MAVRLASLAAHRNEKDKDAVGPKTLLLMLTVKVERVD